MFYSSRGHFELLDRTLTCSLLIGYRHWHADLRVDDSPLEAGLGFTCRLKQRGEGSDFIGRKALEEQLKHGIHKRLVCFTLDKYDYEYNAEFLL